MSLYSHLCMAINVVLEDIYIWVVEIQEGTSFCMIVGFQLF